MSYSVRLNGEKIFDTAVNDDRYRLTQIQLELPGKAVFAIPSENKAYDQIKRFTDYVDVYHDNELIFCGRVFSISEVFNTDKIIECESLNSLLRDALSRPKTFENKTNREVFTELINEYNSQVETSKQINVGRITVTSESCYRAYEVLEYMNIRINTLAENFDSRVVVRKQNNKLYIDWLDSYDEGCDQTIDFGSNLLDITWADDNPEFMTRIVPQGAADENGKRIGISSVNVGHVDYVEAPPQYIQEHGYITGTRIWEDVTDPNNLLRKARAWLNQIINPIKSISVTAIDLSDAGYDLESFKVGQRIKVKSSIHGIDGFFDCTAININPLRPASNRLELGTMVAGYVENNINRNTDAIGYIADIVKKQTVTKTDLDLAIERATAAISGAEGGYIVINDANGDNKPDEILIMDTPDISTARKIWRFNNNGLGYSKKGYAGPYATAMTNSGEIVADMITSGVLNGAIIKAGSISGDSINITDLFSKNITATNMDITGGSVNIETGANTSKITLTNNTSGKGNGLKTEISPNQIKKCGYYDGKLQYETDISSQGIVIKDGDGNVLARYQNNSIVCDGKTLQDFVIEQGTSAGWTYRKWKSGKYECWKTETIKNLAITSAWGYLYEGRIGYYTFPVTFKSAPFLQVSQGGGGAGWFIEASGSTDTTTTPSFYAVRGTSNTIDVTISLYACGTV